MTVASAARQFLSKLTLPGQIACLCVLMVCGVLLLAALGDALPWPTAGAAVLGLVVSGLLSTALAWRSTRALRAIAEAANGLRHDSAPEQLQIPLTDISREFRRTSFCLRRMSDAMRARQRALEAHNAALKGRLDLRTHELSTLQDLSIGLATTSEISELVNEALAALGQTMDYASASLWARGGGRDKGQVLLMGYRTSEEHGDAPKDDLTGMRLSRSNMQLYETIEREREPKIDNRARQSIFSWLWQKMLDDPSSSVLYRASRSWMALPLAFKDEVLGVMRVDHQEDDYFDAERARLLTAVSSQTALAMHHSQLQLQQRENAVVAERNRIARDLHDAVSQMLFAANVMAGTLVRTLEKDPNAAAPHLVEQVRSIEKLNRGALSEMRLMLFELRPDALTNTPLHELLRCATQALECRGSMVVESEISDQDQLPAAVRIQLYRIAQEALSNVGRHSDATRCSLRWMAQGGSAAELSVQDNGRGFDVDADFPGHFGLSNMRSRALEIGADLELQSRLGEGTAVHIRWEQKQA